MSNQEIRDTIRTMLKDYDRSRTEQVDSLSRVDLRTLTGELNTNKDYYERKLGLRAS